MTGRRGSGSCRAPRPRWTSYARRNAADLAWLDRIFDQAGQTHARAVAIGIQADMWDPAFSTPPADPASFDHFTDLVQALAARARAFGRPVLLLNGDSHGFTDDRPLADPARPYQRTMTASRRRCRTCAGSRSTAARRRATSGCG